MTVKITFEDGTSGYLAHYGVKGMKWGVWNSETKAKYGDAESHPSVEKRKRAYNKAELRYSNHGWKGPIRKHVTRALRNRALDQYAKATMKVYDPANAETRERRRQSEEREADKRLGTALRKNNPEAYHKGTDEYYKVISKIEQGRAIDNAVPKGREAVKKILQWGHETSAKTDASISGVPIKTNAEAKKYRALNDRYDKTHYAQYVNPTAKNKKAHEKTLSDFHKFEAEQRRKYLNV